MQSPRFTVVIPTVRAATIGATVDSILRQTVQDWELLIVGQGEEAPLRAALASCLQADPRIRYVHLDRMGLSHARNAAMRHARADVVAFIDDDCEADPRWLEVFGEHLDADPRLGFIVGPLLPPPGPRPWLSECPQVPPVDAVLTPGEGDGGRDFDFGGANFAFRRAVYERVGPMDEYLGAGATFLAAEDIDYKSRLIRAGVRMRSVSAAVVHHTYGRRDGLRAVFRHRRGYAIGQGALAAKLTLGGDPAGVAWLRMIRSDLLRSVRARRVGRAALGLARYWYAWRGYRDCLRRFTVPPEAWLLRPRAGA